MNSGSYNMSCYNAKFSYKFHERIKYYKLIVHVLYINFLKSLSPSNRNREKAIDTNADDNKKQLSALQRRDIRHRATEGKKRNTLRVTLLQYTCGRQAPVDDLSAAMFERTAERSLLSFGSECRSVMRQRPWTTPQRRPRLIRI